MPPLVIMKKILNTIVIITLLIAVLGVLAPIPDTVVVVYESSEIIPEPYVTGALKTLSSEGLQTRVLDKDVTTGEGEVPTQVEAAVSESAVANLPSLVVLSGDTVISSQSLPSTYDGILEAVR